MHAQSFRDLMVYQESRALAREIFEASKKFPREEVYALTDQIRRASRSVGGQIAESWGKRRYEAHFVSKLTDSDAEQLETQHWIETANDCGYLSVAHYTNWIERYAAVGRMLHGMMEKSSQFCGEPERHSPVR